MRAAIALALVISLAIPARAEGVGGIAWEKTLDAAKARAAKEKKPLVIDFWATWCGWCKVQDREVFGKQKMIDFSKGQVYLKLNTEDRGDGTKLAQSLGITGLPTILVMDAQGSEMDRIPGYLPLDPFMEKLQGILQGKGEFQTLTRKATRTPEENMRLAQSYLERNDVERARQTFEGIVKDDPGNAKGFTDDALYMMAQMALFQGKRDEAKKHLQTLVEKYGKEPYADRAREQLKTLQDGGSVQAAPSALPRKPKDRTARYDEVPGFDLAKLTVDQKSAFLEAVNDKKCTCGCEGDTIAQCIHDDPQCTAAPRVARELFAQATAGTLARGATH